ncbi:hypothetical protein GAYE_SCF53G6172 [Galdieria yellowstonensis]|uniref:lipid-A-disaccharide synthase n=1 Tax=Galdieria yellowstonensis TaxID=3028027 RepID=A0AAV9IL86_9RHOD|nr:hypothetical protein GAYE_SCF53G6172 [Galdieria yellowstonensis]
MSLWVASSKSSMLVPRGLVSWYSSILRRFYHIYIITGESSGDKLGYHLVQALQKLDKQLIVRGVGGPLMRKQGMQSLFPAEELSVMGWFPVWSRLFRLVWRWKQVQRDIWDRWPDAIVAIDSKGFSGRIFRYFRQYATKSPSNSMNREKKKPLHIQYVGPSVWAIRDGLSVARKFGQWVDHLLLLFPMETKIWKQVNVPWTVVGPSFGEYIALVDTWKKQQSSTRRKRKSQRLVVLLGSRMQEVKRAAPIVMQCIEKWRQQQQLYDDNPLQLVIPCVGHTRRWMENFVRSYALDIEWVDGEEERGYLEALFTSDLAIAVSGTAVMECHLCQLAVIVIYPCDWWTSWMIRKKVSVPFASIANIMLGKCVVPELLLDQCNVENLLPLLRDGLNRPEWRTRQLLELQPFLDYFRQLVQSQGKPSDIAAKTILSLLKDQTTQ